MNGFLTQASAGAGATSAMARRGSTPLDDTTSTTHVWLDSAGVAWIEDTNVKVVEVVLDRLASGWSPEEIHFQHPQLSLAQIYASLAWYYDHQTELDAEIARRLADVESQADHAASSPLRTRLRGMGLLT